jgi:hypothetical protein
MKKLILLLTMAAIYANLSAQVTYLHSFNASATSVHLNIAGYKYYLMDEINNECRFYNTDFSLWKTISLNIPQGSYLYDIRHVSDNLFDNDSEVELVYITYEYDTTYYYYTYYLKLINENGSVMLDVPGGYFSDVTPVNESEDQFFVYKGDFSTWPYSRETQVYGIPGQISVTENNADKMFLSPPFPNPSRDKINIPYSLPQREQGMGILEILDENGRQVKHQELPGHEGIVPLDLNGFAPGVYQYRIKSGNRTVGSQKFVVVKDK